MSWWCSIASGSAWSKDGQPVPESNCAPDEKSGLPHALHSYVPSAFSWTYSPEKGASVPFSRRTSYSAGVRNFLNPSLLSGNGFCAIPELYQSYPCPVSVICLRRAFSGNTSRKTHTASSETAFSFRRARTACRLAQRQILLRGLSSRSGTVYLGEGLFSETHRGRCDFKVFVFGHHFEAALDGELE